MGDTTKRDWKIRRAIETDAKRLSECMDSAYRPYLERTGGVALPPMAVDYAVEIIESEVWIAELEADLIGAIILAEAKSALQIANIAVHPKAQGKGVGKGLIEFARERALERGYSEMKLATHPLLEENLALYAHLGWAEIARDESHVYLRLEIA